MTINTRTNPTSGDLLKILRDSTNVIDRINAVYEIGQSRNPDVVQDLTAVLIKETDINIRSAIADAFLQIGDEKSRLQLEKLANSDSDATIRSRAINALGQIKDPKSIKWLAEIAIHEKDFLLRIDAIQALGNIGDSSSVPLIENALRNETNSDVRGAIARALGVIGGSSSLHLLSDILRNDKDTNVRIDAAASLGQTKLKDAPKELIQNYTSDLNPEIQKNIEQALLELPFEDSILPLCRALIENDKKEIRLRLTSLLAAMPHWEIKTQTMLNELQNTQKQRRDIDAENIVRAISPSDNLLHDNPYLLTDYLIESCVKKDSRITGLLARLIIESTGGDNQLAGERINIIHSNKRLSDDDSRKIRIEVGGEIALDPIIGVLQDDLQKYFRVPIANLNELTQNNWQKTIQYAQWGFLARIIMSVVVFIIGMLLLCISSYRFMFGNLETSQLWGTGASFISGLGSMLLMVYQGPLREIRNSVNELGIASASFIGYVHRVLQISHTFSYHYLKQNMSFELMKQSSELIGAAMTETLKSLSVSNPNESDQIIKDVLSKLQKSQTTNNA